MSVSGRAGGGENHSNWDQANLKHLRYCHNPIQNEANNKYSTLENEL